MEKLVKAKSAIQIRVDPFLKYLYNRLLLTENPIFAIVERLVGYLIRVLAGRSKILSRMRHNKLADK